MQRLSLNALHRLVTVDVDYWTLTHGYTSKKSNVALSLSHFAVRKLAETHDPMSLGWQRHCTIKLALTFFYCHKYPLASFSFLFVNPILQILQALLNIEFWFLGDRLGFPHPMELPTMNGVNSFAHTVNGMPSMCPTSNGIHLSNNNNNTSTTNGNLHHNVNNNNNNNNGTSQVHQQQAHQHTLLQHNSNSSSDRCSSSGVSSFDPSESRAPRSSLIPPPNLVSDDSNHSSHSHGSSSLTIPHSTTSSGSGSNNSHPLHHQESSRPPTNYKFKNSIKQRFSADQRIKTSSSPPPSEASPKHGQQQGVPIFALHDNGGFYVPLTLEAALLRPHLGYPSPTDLSQDTVLHPVTISVNFNHPSPPTWSQPSPTHQMQQWGNAATSCWCYWFIVCGSSLVGARMLICGRRRKIDDFRPRMAADAWGRGWRAAIVVRWCVDECRPMRLVGLTDVLTDLRAFVLVLLTGDLLFICVVMLLEDHISQREWIMSFSVRTKALKTILVICYSVLFSTNV